MLLECQCGAYIVQEACHWPCHHFVDTLTSLPRKTHMLNRWPGRLALTWASPALFQGLWMCPLHPPFLPFHLCVSVCACPCASVRRLQTDQLSAWAQHQASGRSMSHMWRTKREAVRLYSSDLNMYEKKFSSFKQVFCVTLQCELMNHANNRGRFLATATVEPQWDGSVFFFYFLSLFQFDSL